MRSARPSSSSPRSALTRAEAALMRPSQCTTAGGIGRPDTGKLAMALRVSAPYSSDMVSDSSEGLATHSRAAPAAEGSALDAHEQAARGLLRDGALVPVQRHRELP